MAGLANAFYQNLRNGVEKGDFPLTPLAVDGNGAQGTLMAAMGWRPFTRRRTHEELYTLTMISVHDDGVGLELHVDDPRPGAIQCNGQCDKYFITPDSVSRLRHIGVLAFKLALDDVLREPDDSQTRNIAQTRSNLFDAYTALVEPQPGSDVFMPGQDPKMLDWLIGMNHEHIVNDPVAYWALYQLDYPS
jgi:hypothetical protein